MKKYTKQQLIEKYVSTEYVAEVHVVTDDIDENFTGYYGEWLPEHVDYYNFNFLCEETANPNAEELFSMLKDEVEADVFYMDKEQYNEVFGCNCDMWSMFGLNDDDKAMVIILSKDSVTK